MCPKSATIVPDPLLHPLTPCYRSDVACRLLLVPPWPKDQDTGKATWPVEQKLAQCPPAQFLLTLLLPEAERNSLPGYRAPAEEYTLLYSGDDKSTSYDICKDFKVGSSTQLHWCYKVELNTV